MSSRSARKNRERHRQDCPHQDLLAEAYVALERGQRLQEGAENLADEIGTEDDVKAPKDLQRRVGKYLKKRPELRWDAALAIASDRVAVDSTNTSKHFFNSDMASENTGGEAMMKSDRDPQWSETIERATRRRAAERGYRVMVMRGAFHGFYILIDEKRGNVALFAVTLNDIARHLRDQPVTCKRPGKLRVQYVQRGPLH
jgi:hypothetical protein